ncbi:hypothetical protein ACJX0J_033576, partial [Zea mays]
RNIVLTGRPGMCQTNGTFMCQEDLRPFFSESDVYFPAFGESPPIGTCYRVIILTKMEVLGLKINL